MINYTPVIKARAARLEYLRSSDRAMQLVCAHYRDHPADFINDWGFTFDPRNVERGIPSTVPFLLFPKQREWINWTVERWKKSEPGATEKSRDMGVSWLSVALADTLCIFREEMVIGFGSRKAEYVDKLKAPKSLFWKARRFLERLPEDFTGGWSARRDSVEMRISFPVTGSVIAGEAGDGIGRGDRSSLYFVDESAHLERSELVDASLSATTNCRIDISSANGTDNSFYNKVTEYPPARVFTFHWRDDPRKDQAWYDKQVEELSPVVVAQEIDINYSASKVGILIPSEWVSAAIDAHVYLGMEISGARRAALDVADEGHDKNALAMGWGTYVDQVPEWTGKNSDPYATTERAFTLADVFGASDLYYDADGLGASVRGDARKINETRPVDRKLRVSAFRGSGAVHDPDKPIPTLTVGRSAGGGTARTNGDFFHNAKSQGWWTLRVKFQRTHRAVELVKAGKTHEYAPQDLIFLNGKMDGLGILTRELSQPTYSQTDAGKIRIDKHDGGKSPNKGDAVMILNAPRAVNFLAAVSR